MNVVSVVVSYCSNERAFIDAMLTQCLEFSDDVVVSYGSHLYDGSPEDLDHIGGLFDRYPEVFFVSYEVDVTREAAQTHTSRPKARWHNQARWSGVNALTRREWVLFLDADEIPEGAAVRRFLSGVALDPATCYKFANYWYIGAPTVRATAIEDSVMMMRRDDVTRDLAFGQYERDSMIAGRPSVRRNVLGVDGEVMFHHYSWVRTPAQLTHKASFWGHSSDQGMARFPEVVARAVLAAQHARPGDSVDFDDGGFKRYSYVCVADRFGLGRAAFT